MNVIEAGIINYSRSDICGISFTAGQDIIGGWAQRTCGSVVTCVVDGQSRYGTVLRFFSHQCERNTGVYAYVRWFRKTDYPFEGSPLVVRIRDNAPPVSELSQQVVSIFDIDPSRVVVERSDSESCYYMCRIEGLDTIR